MGIKNRLEGKLNRAQKEGRTEDAQHLEELLNELKRTRGDAAYARTLGGNYQVRAGDTAFSVAESELGDEALVAALLLANPGVDKLKKGMYLNLPDSESLAAYEALQQAEGRAGAAVGRRQFGQVISGDPAGA